MLLELGCKVLVTTDEWFFAPDGESYRAVFGTVKAIHTDKDTLGIETNSKSTNWYLEIGNMFIAGCQIHYAIKTDSVSSKGPSKEFTHEDKLITKKFEFSRIYHADA